MAVSLQVPQKIIYLMWKKIWHFHLFLCYHLTSQQWSLQETFLSILHFLSWSWHSDLTINKTRWLTSNKQNREHIHLKFSLLELPGLAAASHTLLSKEHPLPIYTLSKKTWGEIIGMASMLCQITHSFQLSSLSGAWIRLRAFNHRGWWKRAKAAYHLRDRKGNLTTCNTTPVCPCRVLVWLCSFFTELVIGDMTRGPAER